MGDAVKRRAIKISLAIGALLLAAAAVVGILSVRGRSADAILAERRQPNGDLTRSQMERLLACVERDMTAMVGRQAQLPPSLPPSTRLLVMLASLRGYQYTPERLAREGTAAWRPLTTYILDPTAAANLRHLSVCVIRGQDPYATLAAVIPALKDGTLRTPFGDMIVDLCMPSGAYGTPGKPPAAPLTCTWLLSRLETRTLDQVYLERLDELMASPNFWPGDENVLRWLNRFYGDDFDEFLAKGAPEVLAFRNKELARGYDPVAFLSDPYLVARQPDYFDDKGLAKIYSDPSDRSAMERLGQLVETHRLQSSRMHPTDECRKKLVDWYKANRSRLVYDAAKLRFVVGKPEVPSLTVESTGK